MSDDPMDQPTPSFNELAATRPYYTLFLIWLWIAGLWKTVEIGWVVLRGLAGLIA